ncbi:coiled-coil and C2 domain-containing protein 2A [Ditylenchus destructor]|uniref:Coiled-coil and C2 domain-containing protein 2A n=1 Tax=Ditylenchus destructor TaxID=166010 RepID=A0AAD4R4X4_9BILA|nr:coiled-coil and C2 domain-containing protein 2A [Ditylenchus destructor]
MDNLEEIPSVYVNDSNGSNSDHTHPEPAARRTLQPAKRASIPKVGWSDIAETSSIIPPDPDSNVSASSAPDPTFSSELDMLPSVDSSSDIQQIANGGYASPDASSQSSSKSSRRPEMSVHARQRIRQQAKSMVEKKRGSVQLAKRLLRSQALQSASVIHEKQDFSGVDNQIESTIELASKYAARSQSLAAPEHLQRSFFFGTSDQEDFLEDVRPKPRVSLQITSNRAITELQYAKPLVESRARKEAGNVLLTTYPARNVANTDTTANVEDPFTVSTESRASSHLFAARPPRNLSAIIQRAGSSFIANGGLRGLENMLDKPQRIDRDESDDVDLVVYRKAEDWDQSDDTRGQPTYRFARLEIDLNRIEFHHHWLFSIENALASDLKALYDEYCQLVKCLLSHVKEYMDQKQQLNIHQAKSESETRYNEELGSILTEIRNRGKQIARQSEFLDRAWEKLQQFRQSSNIFSTDLMLHKNSHSDIPWNGIYNVNEAPEEIRDLFNYPSYELKEAVIPVPSTRPSQESQKLEEGRIDAIKRCRIQIQIHFNNILVCSTEEAFLNPKNFRVIFAKLFDLEIFERPEDISLTIRERFGRGPWQHVAQVFLPVPDINDDENKSEIGSSKNGLLSMEFASEIVRGSHKGSMGCGRNVGSPFMHGKVYCKTKWIKGSKHLTQNNDQSYIDSPNAQLDLLPIHLVTEEEFNLSPSFSALIQRSDQSRRANIQSLTKSAMHGNDAAHDASTELSLDVYRRVGHSYAVMVRRHFLENFSSGYDRRMKEYSEIVREEPLPTLFRAFGTIFGPPDLSRKLKPMRTSLTSRPQQAFGNQYRIMINIQYANNLPERVSGDRSRVFVEAAFRKEIARTTIVEGQQANWHETLCLTLDTPVEQIDFKSIIDSLQFNVFDQLITELDHDDREPNTLHEQIESRWIASAHIPFSAIYALGKVDGILILAPPLFCSGYRMVSDKHITMKILITIDPPLVPPVLDTHVKFPSDPAYEKHISICEKWEKRLRANFPERKYLSMVNASNGKRVILSRFLRKIPPPSKILQAATLNIHNAVVMAINLIRNIPFIADPVMFPGNCDLWTTADEMLTIGCGDEEEHAILLVCWLMSLEIPAALILGTSLPEGPKAAYVLVQFDELESWLINPCDGFHYFPDDPLCPLFSVGTIVTSTNIYGNVQRSTHPSLLDFDLRKKLHWDPLFADTIESIESLQANIVRYNNVSEDLLVELRTNLEREIKFRFDEARNYGIPQWNLVASRLLRDILSETWQTEGILDNGMLDVEGKFAQLRLSHRVTAVAFSGPYISKKKLVKAILKTNMHVNSDRNAQFALAVFIHPFINEIVNCSVALASLSPLLT